MKIAVYSLLNDELDFFQLMEKKYNTKFTFYKHYLNIDTVKETQGFDSIVINARDEINNKVLDRLKDLVLNI